MIRKRTLKLNYSKITKLKADRFIDYNLSKIQYLIYISYWFQRIMEKKIYILKLIKNIWE